MKAAVLHKIHDLRLEEREKPSPGPGEVLVQVKSVGVCGSDVHYYNHGRIGTQVVTSPMVIGHEGSGVVAEVGANVKGLKEGDNVAVEPGVPCLKCDQCVIGKYNLCYDMKFLGTPPIDGAYVEYMLRTPEFLFPMPSGMSFDEGAMVEPLAVGVHAVDLAELRTAETVAVLGMGSIGWSTLQVALKGGAGKTIVTDLLDNRLEIARKCGADITINASKENVVERILEETGGRGVDVAFEAAGQPECFQQCFEIIARSGRVVLIGICQEDMIPVNWTKARHNELTVRVVRRFRNTYRRAIRLASDMGIDLNALVTHHFPLDDIVDAFKMVDARDDGVLKAIINVT